MRSDPAVRLAYNPGPINAYRALAAPEKSSRLMREKKSKAPSVRLATTIAGGGSMSPAAFERHLERAADAPALLVSYVYLEPFLKHRPKYHYRDWVLDSGAFSAHNSGTEIKLQDYIEACKRLAAEDPTLSEVFALDVIGDWKASLKNCEEMWKQGMPAIPCYHVGEPEHVLKTMARDYPKIALGGAVGFKRKDEWAAQCFARVWPKKIHGFGFGSEKSIMAAPFHSVDATNWEVGPCKFGRWQTFGQMSVRGSKQNLRAEVEWYLKLEARARTRWAKEMAELEALSDAPAMRLACNGAGQGEMNGSLGAPSLRLACADSPAERNGSLSPVVRLASQQMSDAQVERSGFAPAPTPSLRRACADTPEQRIGATFQPSIDDQEG